MWNDPTQDQLEKPPRRYATEDVAVRDKIILMHFFIGGCDWYMAECDPTSGCSSGSPSSTATLRMLSGATSVLTNCGRSESGGLREPEISIGNRDERRTSSKLLPPADGVRR